MSELILYQTEDGKVQVKLRAEDGSVWLSQAEMAELFSTTVPNANIHIRNILKEGEQDTDSVIKESLITAADGKRYRTKLYRLEMILAVGYRVKGPRGTQFRQWATTYLAEYLIKGFVMDDERLKNPGGWDYFDELLARIREIRASEQRFYQKVRDLFALSADYQASDSAAQQFFAEVQNKLLYAVTQKTAAQIVVDRSNPEAPNMALTTWSGSRVRKQDVIVAKNYLTEEELNILNRIVTAYLEVAEIQALNRIPMTMRDWMERLHQFLTMTGREVLAHAGQISHEAAMHKARVEYEKFCTARAQLPTAVEQHFVEAERRVQQNIPSRDRNKS